jgi:predicted RNA-binding protein (virulence factor B family)
MNLGTYNELEVVRISDIAYILSDGDNEIFLHKKEALREYVAGDVINVFIYVDNLNRPTASTKHPFVTIDSSGFLEVVEINYEYGVFLNNGLIKDLLLSKDDLPLSIQSWPVIGDELYVTMKVKKEQLFAKFVPRKIIQSILKPKEILEIGNTYDAIVMFLLVEGLVCFTKAGHEIFVHYNNTRQKYRLGETVNVRILKLNENEEYVGTLIQQKELMLEDDAKSLLQYLENHSGQMRFTDASSPEEIQAAFHMSKSAFKRALGTLYKSGLVELRSDKTVLKQKS